MSAFHSRLVFALLVSCLLASTQTSAAEVEPEARFTDLVQPFLITFERSDVQVIVYMVGHPEYEAVEAFVSRRAGREPLIRAVITRHGGFQIDHYNDEEIARERATVLTERLTVYRPIQYEEGVVDGLPVVRLRFTTHQDEELLFHFESSTPPAPELGGFINPGSHSSGGSLPVMWANASASGTPATRVTIDGISYSPAPGPVPGSLFAVYTEGFLIGVLRQGRLQLWQLWSPRRLAVGERWLYWDNLGNLHDYEIIGIDGDLLTLHKTTTSAFLSEEVITAQLMEGQLHLRSVRNTGRLGKQDGVPPPPQGFTLELSTDARFSLSIDEHARLVTGTASRQVHDFTTTWRLQPLEPSWATSRVVRASLSRDGNRYVIENTVGQD